MIKFKNHAGFLLALLVLITIVFACGDKKESEVKKESTKEETKSETTTKEETKSTTGNQLYFVEEYTKEGQEVGKSDKFYIPQKGGYITAMLRTTSPIGVGSVDVRLERESVDGSEIIDTKPYDVFPDKSYFFFDKITFYKSGDYKVTVFKKDGTPIASGTVRIDYK
ncbi:MAG: hypothetical protein JSS91_10015 [Bacteroidetes bacterium]|nr:hypothetical protein [Bacteroidota bacterium]